MKEVKDTPKIKDYEEQIEKKRRSRLGKMWKLAKQQKVTKTIQLQNSSIEYYYILILTEVKIYLGSQHPIVFERDYREDNSENSFAMHSFLAPNIYLHLMCDLNFHYWIEYDFHECWIEDRVRIRIAKLFEFSQQARHRPLQPNCFEYHKSVIAKQDPQYIYTL